MLRPYMQLLVGAIILLLAILLFILVLKKKSIASLLSKPAAHAQ